MSGNCPAVVPYISAIARPASKELEGHSLVASSIFSISSGINAIRLPKTRHAPSFFARRRTRFGAQPIALANISGVIAFMQGRPSCTYGDDAGFPALRCDVGPRWIVGFTDKVFDDRC